MVTVPVTDDELDGLVSHLDQVTGGCHSEGGAETQHQVRLVRLLGGRGQHVVLETVPKVNDGVHQETLTVLQATA